MESNSGMQEDQQKEKPKILPLPNGPYYLLNDMQPKTVENLQNSEGKQLSTIVGVALCRCGASKNKPFCDGTHGTIGFSSENKIAENGGSGSEEKKVIKDRRKVMLARKLQFMITGEFAAMLLNA